ncbi:MAG: aldo/keto reductase [Deltaproteobacteria bacterium]|nr:aldo/keto reductase [Deltaproteobacteria bacterium]
MTLPTRTLGPTGIEVSLLGLGGMPMSISGRPAEAQSIAVIHRALELGVTLIDTADVYCLNDDDLGHNERVIAKALATYAGDRSRVLVATKGGLERPNGAWTVNGRPAHLRQACERSLRALHVERIALYQLHAVDDRVPIEDSVGELARLRSEGKIEHLGLSNVDANEIDRAIAIAPIVSVQNRFHVRDRRGAIDNGALAKCQALGLAFLPYSPVGGSRGKSRLGQDPTLLRIASKHGASPHEIALAWLLGLTPSLLPIPGASKVSSIESSVRAAAITLDDDDRHALQ